MSESHSEQRSSSRCYSIIMLVLGACIFLGLHGLNYHVFRTGLYRLSVMEQFQKDMSKESAFAIATELGEIIEDDEGLARVDFPWPPCNMMLYLEFDGEALKDIQYSYNSDWGYALPFESTLDKLPLNAPLFTSLLQSISPNTLLCMISLAQNRKRKFALTLGCSYMGLFLLSTFFGLLFFFEFGYF